MNRSRLTLAATTDSTPTEDTNEPTVQALTA